MSSDSISHCSSLSQERITYIVQEVIDLVNTSLESGSCLSNDTRVSISLGLFVKCTRNLVECALMLSA
jgi:hypothetical protein